MDYTTETYLRQTIRKMAEQPKINVGNLWRYSINEGDFGGVVIAETLDKAAEKVTKKYGNKGNIDVWMVKNDDFYDKENKDVIECYGIG